MAWPISEPPNRSDIYLKHIVAYVKALMSQVSKEDLQFARNTDLDEVKPFQDYLLFHRIISNSEQVEEALYKSNYADFLEYIMFLKQKYAVPRPFDLAKQMNVRLPFHHGSETATNASYPSGHAASAFYIANILTKEFLKDHPFRDRHRYELFNLANRISWGRVCLGVHSLQDIREGARLANALFA
tara:strand:- start:1118 stop:1675 length:558 start_codon:yes stop_codon:yes gene_type:complete